MSYGPCFILHMKPLRNIFFTHSSILNGTTQFSHDTPKNNKIIQYTIVLFSPRMQSFLFCKVHTAHAKCGIFVRHTLRPNVAYRDHFVYSIVNCNCYSCCFSKEKWTITLVEIPWLRPMEWSLLCADSNISLLLSWSTIVYTITDNRKLVFQSSKALCRILNCDKEPHYQRSANEAQPTKFKIEIEKQSERA